jgi:TFIIF-interacting CTD phosphatase-like protein
MYLYLRPGLLTFLERLSGHFELVLFNNGSRAFTDAVIQELQMLSGNEDFNYFSYVLCKDHCSTSDGGQEIKCLDLFCGEGSGRDIKTSLIVDNNLYCF